MKTTTVAKKQPRNDEQVKLDAEVVRDARLVCAYRRTVMAEYMSGLLAPLVSRDLAEEQKKDQAKRGQKGKA